MVAFTKVDNMYRRYSIDIKINNSHFTELWIDPHYEIKHKDSINDSLILELVKQVDGWLTTMSSEINGYQFYKAEGYFQGKAYRLILVIPPDSGYLGIRNAYRRSN